jgi:multidrug transporter EmrE-like cation transporter
VSENVYDESIGMGHMNLVWSCTSIIICYIISHFVYKESINKYTVIAILLAIAAIYFAHQSDENA